MTIHEALVIALAMEADLSERQREAIDTIIDDHEKLLRCCELCRQVHGRPEAE